ncbi:uncharacterized protein MELLADRAFT_124044 [Melampsora larici-populina 98AG31]|uniref:Secreted protein n=1 Tax=Melampsora larici-populina (strain 98AG31 / pathotype 3-4-7) TaxID=747676 RepID=F4RUS1_MELLP|nr:uncharacterized protein MELLADRAFT_124044 [Melampsora larici-populina 98AG31]EGG03872.1 secreted protein [Melampsora larici-populina 98AG31]
MISRTYILIIFALLTLFGKSESSKDCKWAFERVPNNPAYSYCSDHVSTYKYPSADCKPQLQPNGVPIASKCDSNQFPTGPCPTWRASGYHKTNKVVSYMCDFLTKKGATPDKDQYTKIKCEILTNVVYCDGDNGVKVGRDIPS